ncbi:hypothetical protein ABE957_06145 [Halomonas sp. CS7]|uniref:O-antigen ligase domain-containing protein n=1 Tax=Halomonas pelophila TaxID=3151122 RepID=A0ABV1N3E9_9GAMM
MINLAFFVFSFRVLTIGLPLGVVGYASIPIILFSSLMFFLHAAKDKIEFGLFALITSQYLLVAILVVSFMVSLLNGFPVSVSLENILKFLLFIAVVHLGYRCGGDVRAIKYFKIVFWILVAHVFCGVLFSILGYGVNVHGSSRAAGIAGGVQIYANIVMLLFVLSCSLIYFRSNLFSKRLLYLSVFLCILAFFYSSTLKNMLVGVFVLALISLLSVKRAIWFLAFCAFVFVITKFFLAGVVEDLTIFKRLQDIMDGGFDTSLSPGEELDSSLVWRIMHWKLLLSDWVENHFLFGAGLGQSVNLDGLKMPSGDGYEAHSDIVAFLVEFGVVLSPLFFLFVLIPFFVVLHCSIKEKNPIFSSVFMSSLSVLLSSFGGNVFYSLAALYFMWFFIGWVIGNMDKRRSDSKVKKGAMT